jgi:hypothetical protein
MTKTYERQDGETTKAYTAFTLYRDMGSARSLEKTAQKFYTPDSPQIHPRNISQIETWSSKWNWVQRVRDFDLDEETILRDRARQSSSSIKAIGALGSLGSDLAADGLLIRQLMEKLKENEN